MWRARQELQSQVLMHADHLLLFCLHRGRELPQHPVLVAWSCTGNEGMSRICSDALAAPRQDQPHRNLPTTARILPEEMCGQTGVVVSERCQHCKSLLFSHV